MKLIRLLAITLFLSQGFSPSWGSFTPLLVKEAARPQRMVASAPSQNPQQALLPTLPDDIIGDILSYSKGTIVGRIMITSKAYSNKVKEKATVFIHENNKLDHSSLPKTIFYFRKLKELNILRYSFVDLPDELSNLIHLEHLDLSYNYIHDADLLSVICSLPKLQSLKLQNNNLKRLPNEFSRLTNLTRFENIRNKNNDPHSLSLICSLPKLQSLKLENNGLNNFPNEFSRLTNLRELFFSQSFSIDSRSVSFFGPLIKLEILSFRNCGIKTLPEELTFLTNLRSIDISFNSLTSLPPFNPGVKVIGFDKQDNILPHG